jgi:hypothetical protein
VAVRAFVLSLPTKLKRELQRIGGPPPSLPLGEPRAHLALQRAAAPHEPSWCHKHEVTMKWRDGNARGPGWFSHQLSDGSYCKGR